MSEMIHEWKNHRTWQSGLLEEIPFLRWNWIQSTLTTAPQEHAYIIVEKRDRTGPWHPSNLKFQGLWANTRIPWGQEQAITCIAVKTTPHAMELDIEPQHIRCTVTYRVVDARKVLETEDAVAELERRCRAIIDTVTADQDEWRLGASEAQAQMHRVDTQDVGLRIEDVTITMPGEPDPAHSTSTAVQFTTPQCTPRAPAAAADGTSIITGEPSFPPPADAITDGLILPKLTHSVTVTAKKALELTQEQLGRIPAVLVKHLSPHPRVILWLASAAGVLTVCGVWLWLNALQPWNPQPPHEGPPHAPSLEAGLPAVEMPAAPVTPGQDHAPSLEAGLPAVEMPAAPVTPGQDHAPSLEAGLPAVEMPAAPVTPGQDHAPSLEAGLPAVEMPAAPVTPGQDQIPRPEEMQHGVVTQLQAAGLWCGRPGQSPCLHDVTVSDTGWVHLAGILCYRQNKEQVRTLLQQVPGVTGVEMNEKVNIIESWGKVPRQCLVPPWSNSAKRTP